MTDSSDQKAPSNVDAHAEPGKSSGSVGKSALVSRIISGMDSVCLGLAVALIALGSVAEVLLFLVVFDAVREYGAAFVFYYIMTFVLGCYGFFCSYHLSVKSRAAFRMTVLLLAITLIHNLIYWNMKPWIQFAKYIAIASAILLAYFLKSPAVRNDYAGWEEDENGLR